MVQQLLSNHVLKNNAPFSKEQLTVNEYVLVMQPHEDLHHKIMDIKKQFADTYNCAQALYSKPNITLLRFEQINILEPKIIQHLQKLVAPLMPFMVTLDGFGNHPSHSLFIKVTSTTKITELIKLLKPIQSLLQYNKEQKPHFIAEPNISIARKLLPWQYEQSWKHYAHVPLSAHFMATQLVLLKRTSKTEAYSIAAKISLSNNQAKPVVQTMLFN